MDYNLQEANEYRKKEEYQKAIEFYRALWNQNPLSFNQWDGWGYAFSLYKTQQYQEALTICRALYPRFKKFDLLRSLYARSILQTQFKSPNPPSLEVLDKALKGIFMLSPPYEPYAVSPLAVFQYAKIAMAQQNISWSKIEYWLGKMEPGLLDAEAFQSINTDGRSYEVASQQEQWYALMLKSKAGQNKAEELLSLLAEARKKKLKWHYNNDIWFARKEAFAYAQLHQKEKAVQILKKILLQKKDWFLIYDLAKLTEDSNERKVLLCQAALAKGKPTMKLKLFESIYQEFLDEDPQMAGKHLSLIASLRKENNWEVSPSLTDKINQLNPEGSVEESKTLLRTLKEFWKKHIPDYSKSRERQNGKVMNILPNGFAGFIKTKTESVFFSLKDFKGPEKIKEGDQVSFEVVDSFDKKKQKRSQRAIKIKLES